MAGDTVYNHAREEISSYMIFMVVPVYSQRCSLLPSFGPTPPPRTLSARYWRPCRQPPFDPHLDRYPTRERRDARIDLYSSLNTIFCCFALMQSAFNIMVEQMEDDHLLPLWIYLPMSEALKFVSSQCLTMLNRGRATVAARMLCLRIWTPRVCGGERNNRSKVPAWQGGDDSESVAVYLPPACRRGRGRAAPR